MSGRQSTDAVTNSADCFFLGVRALAMTAVKNGPLIRIFRRRLEIHEASGLSPLDFLLEFLASWRKGKT